MTGPMIKEFDNKISLLFYGNLSVSAQQDAALPKRIVNSIRALPRINPRRRQPLTDGSEVGQKYSKGSVSSDTRHEDSLIRNVPKTLFDRKYVGFEMTSLIEAFASEIFDEFSLGRQREGLAPVPVR